MAEIIAFRPRERSLIAALSPNDGAQILFFLGVRYESKEDAQKPKPHTPDKPRKASARKASSSRKSKKQA